MRSRKYMFGNAAALAFVTGACCAAVTACGPDKETEALREENAALRRDAENRETGYGTSTPLTDSARAAAGLSARPALPSGPKSVVGAAESQVTVQEVDNANPLGLPIYPKAKLSRLPGGPDNSVLTGGGVNIVLLETTDKLESVVAFYLDKMTASNADPNIPGSKKPPSRADRVQDKFRVVTLSDAQPDGGMRSVTVHEDVGKTYIELLNITGTQKAPASVLPAGAMSSARAIKGTAASTAGPAAYGRGPSSVQPTSGQQPDNDPLNPTLLLPRGKQ